MKKLRQEFADTMVEVGQSDERLVVMVGDISHGILQPYAKACPNRYFNIGICEPSIVNMAAGLSKAGLIPVVHTIAPFIIERAYEQIKLDFGYQKLGINLISVGSAFDYSQLGCSHHCYSDLSLMSHFKEACIFHPGSAVELNQLFHQNYTNGKINYFRLTEFPHGVELEPQQIKTGRGIVVRRGSDYTLAVIGAQLKNAVAAAEHLAADGIDVEVLYFPTIQPFDSEITRSSLAKTKRVIVIEEASSHGSVFDRVVRATVDIPEVSYKQIAIEDFVHSYGSYEDLCNKVGLTVETIVKTIQEGCVYAS